VKNAASEEERKKFLALIQYFQKYGEQYDVDWMLMGAQGYQESQLNQNAKSSVGAIGVMQVMPATGKDMKVGDITETEANIHAGIKYMRWMIDH
jgi:membrane-bound lytic murein transglycosylase MltF